MTDLPPLLWTDPAPCSVCGDPIPGYSTDSAAAMHAIGLTLHCHHCLHETRAAWCSDSYLATKAGAA